MGVNVNCLCVVYTVAFVCREYVIYFDYCSHSTAMALHCICIRLYDAFFCCCCCCCSYYSEFLDLFVSKVFFSHSSCLSFHISLALPLFMSLFHIFCPFVCSTFPFGATISNTYGHIYTTTFYILCWNYYGSVCMIFISTETGPHLYIVKSDARHKCSIVRRADKKRISLDCFE